MDENPYRGPRGDSGGAPQPPNGPRSSLVKRLMVVGMSVLVIGFLLALLLPLPRSAGGTARRNQCSSQLHQIAVALQMYADQYHALPPARTVDADCKPLHSWRTLILPYMEHADLYKSIDLTKPWDDPANAAVGKQSVYGYHCPASSGPANYTTYLAILTPTSCLRADEPRKLSDITDGSTATLIVIEVDADHAVPWMSPVDADEQVVLGLGPKSKLAHAGGMNAVFVDSRIRFLPDDLPAAVRLALISIAGNDQAVTADAY